MSMGAMWKIVGAALLASAVAAPQVASAQGVSTSMGDYAGELQVPLNKSQVLRVDRPYAKALVGNSEIADILPLTDDSLYVLGQSIGTTSLTLYDASDRLIAVVDVAVGPDVGGLKRQLSELMPGDQVGARMLGDAIVLEGVVSSSVAADRALRLAEAYNPARVINMLQIGSSQQVMLEVRFSEIRRSALKDLGISFFFSNDDVVGAVGDGAALGPNPDGDTVVSLGSIQDAFGVISGSFSAFGADILGTLDALERKGVVSTLAEPTLVSLSGETASFLAGGEFPIPVAQGGVEGASAISVQFKPFGVGLAFTPTVLADGVINLVVEPEVSSIDPSASVTVNGLVVPGLQTRRASTVVELRDGESFALAGLIRTDFNDTVRQFPILGSIPIIGTLFRSSGFQRDETELVIVVTPRLVRPVPAGTLPVPTDRVTPPDEIDLFLLGRTDSAVPTLSLPGEPNTEVWYPIGEPATDAAPADHIYGGGMASVDPATLEGDYGHDY
ncbi:type II and III secretion system protein family protein [Sphingomicrobium aestuariivivum]|uniref:type II and III secretion system protein family protein n=1 Tax=Sphingomicrobium aestuariivivum TaxID=1582356 RepID=UPI001FD63C7D|nr:type II and III secretion system protein family protein [Sphingomicrobium aestuariivivum]MCJ8191046.1 type II and III secretion system protein family protein [Sphingomicrobium aestuariivivum]